MNTPRDYLTEQPYSRPIADLLAGRHEMPESPTDRVRLLAELQILNNAKDLFGWWEHTSDWDWRITLETTDNIPLFDSDHYFSDTFRLDMPDPTIDNLDFHSLPEEARQLPTHVIFTIYPDNADAYDMSVTIANIIAITIEEA